MTQNPHIAGNRWKEQGERAVVNSSMGVPSSLGPGAFQVGWKSLVTESFGTFIVTTWLGWSWVIALEDCMLAKGLEGGRF